MKSALAAVLYYGIARRFPTQPVPLWRVGYALRRILVGWMVSACGKHVIVKQNAYIGRGRGLVLGDHAQLGENCRIGPFVTIGAEVVMGPDVVIMTTAHAFEDPRTPIRLQGDLAIRPVVIGADAWIGTRVVILPGVTIGKGAVIGAGSVVTRDIPPMSIAAGNPARVIRQRGDRIEVTRDA